MNIPPITSPTGSLLAMAVAAVMFAVGSWIGSGGLARFRESKAGNVVGVIVISALIIWKH
jgi:hypothetical protein